MKTIKSEIKDTTKPKKIKCYREGRITRNPFFNFLRQFRKERCGLTILQIASQGAQQWRAMNICDKCLYVTQVVFIVI